MRISLKNPAERLTATYLFALSLIALLTISSQVLIRSSLSAQADDSRVINISGRQRMLSQRLSKQALILQNTQEAAEFRQKREDLRQSLELWEKSHNGLQFGDADLGLPGKNSSAISAMFAQSQPYFQAMQSAARQILALSAPGAIAAPARQILAHENDFLQWMNKITFQYDSEAKLRVDRLKQIELALLLVTLLMLTLEALLVFRPTANAIHSYVGQLNAANLELQALNAEIERSEREKQTAQETLILQLRENEILQKRINTELERMVKERTAKIEHAMRLVEQANQTKSQFMANMSHELRTPLNAIIGYSEILAEDAAEMGEENFVRDVKNIHRAGVHLLGLVNDVLDISKIEAGKIELYLEEFALAELLEEILSTVKPLIQKKGNTLVVEAGDTAGMMRTDVTKVRQVLLNLLSNAAKFTENGTIILRVERFEDSGGERLVFHVSDEGIGMTPEQVGKLFQPFTQVDASTTRKYGGTGLGLVISKYFIEMMGGNVKVASESGHGTTFSVELPVRVKTSGESQAALSTYAPPAPVVQQEAVALPEKEAQGQPENVVLVVDDDKDARTLMSNHLAALGHRAVLAASGEEALRLARKIHPSLITLDVMMEGMDGWMVLSALKADPGLAEVPVIMISLLEDKALGHELGVEDYLVKPVSRAQLAESLKKQHFGADQLKVLIIDDDPINRDMMKESLKKTGWQVSQAENGEKALRVLDQQRPDLILLDLMMPQMDGFEFIHHLRSHESWRDIPVIVLTSKELNPEERGLLKQRAQRVFQKGAYQKGNLVAEASALLQIRRAAEKRPVAA
jgi:signal transduction histidine kinase/CheY-like chemotaxis protein